MRSLLQEMKEQVIADSVEVISLFTDLSLMSCIPKGMGMDESVAMVDGTGQEGQDTTRVPPKQHLLLLFFKNCPQ